MTTGKAARGATTMRALIFDGTAAVLRDSPVPTPVGGEALVRPLQMGITPPDLAVLDGRIAFTGIMGHEFVGVVEGVGDAGASRWCGTRVVCTPWVPCAACETCTRGLGAQCPRRTVIGLHGRDGCFAERLCVPVANLVEVPKGVRDEVALFAHAAAAALHAARLVRFEGKPYVTILGDGVPGLVAAQVLASLNASVRLLGTNPARYTLCERWGIRHRHIDEVGRRADQDIVVDCTGQPAGLEVAMRLVRPRGTIVACSAPALVPLAGLKGHAPGADLSPVVCNELHIVGCGAGSLRDGIDALARGGIDTSPFITRRLRLADTGDALSLARHPDTLRVVMTA
jgi:alcohol dehydrogenase